MERSPKSTAKKTYGERKKRTQPDRPGNNKFPQANPVRLATEDVKTSRSLLEAALDSTADGLLMVSLDGKITQFNRKFIEMWGMPKDLAPGCNVDQALEIARTRVRDPEAYVARVMELYRNPDTEAIDEVEFHDGRIIERYSQPQRLGGRVVGRVWSFRDITDRRKAEAALAKSEAELRALVEQVPAIIYTTLADQPGKAIYISPQIEAMTGYTPAEWMASSNFWREIVHPEDRAYLIEQEDPSKFPPGAPFQAEYRLLSRDGRVVWVLDQAALIHDSSGRELFWQGIMQDITDKKQAEEALEKSEAELRALLAAMPDLVLVLDKDGRYTKIAPTSQHLLYRSQEELLGKTLAEVFPPALAENFLACIRSALSQNCTVQLEYSLTIGKKDLWFSASVSPMTKDSVIWIARDITEHKQAEAALLQSEELFRTSFRTSPDSININRMEDGLYVDINDGFTAITGYSREEVIGRTSAEISIWADPADRARLVQGLKKSGQVNNMEAKFRMKDGALLTGLMSAKVIVLKGVPHILSITRNIEEKKRAEIALQKSNEELARLYRASGTLQAGSFLNPQEQAQKIVEVVQEEFGQDNCSLFVTQKDSNELPRLAVAGPYADQVRNARLTLNGGGIVPRAIRTGETINLADVQAEPGYVPNWEAARSELTIPLKIGSVVIGAIDVQSPQPNAFSKDDERIMSIFAERAALFLEHSRLNSQTEARIQQLTSLRTVDMAISGSFDVQLTLGVLLDQVMVQIGVHAADILIFNPATQTFRYSCERGFRVQTLRHVQLKYGTGYAWQAVRDRKTVQVEDINDGLDGLQRSPDLSPEHFVSYIGFPLIAKGQIKGILEVFHREPLKLEPECYSFLELLAGQAAIAIDNAELFDNLQSSNSELSLAYEKTLEGWASALELRDQETEGHTRRTTELTVRLARAMGINDSEIIHLYRGALLHDIGKMGVPDSIIRKPGPLTEEEWVSMRKHPLYAHDLLSPIAYLRLALDIPYCHHERWDGTGYPRGLKGEQIPLSARIFAVVDVWDALTSERPYRKEWTEADARTYIREQAGAHFDPEVVKVFLQEIKERQKAEGVS